MSKGLPSKTGGGGGWGLGAWGGGGAKGIRGESVPDFSGNKGENLADVIARERALARRLAKAELRADETVSR